MSYTNIIDAVEEAMEDMLANNGEVPSHNPAVMRDRDGSYYYGSALQGDEVIIDLDDGFGSYQPETFDDIGDMAAAFAKII